MGENVREGPEEVQGLMGQRLADGTWKEACLDKVKPGEPIFVLRAQDKLAPSIVEEWAHQAETRGAPVDKVNEAYDCARAMRDWARSNGCKYPD